MHSRLLQLLAFFFFLVLISDGFSQERQPNKFNFEGLVYGYHNDPGKLFGADKKMHLEGVLRNVKLEFKTGGRTVSTDMTGTDGFFRGSLDIGQLYEVKFKKAGYAEGSFTLDLRKVPEDIAAAGLVFSGMELILNEYLSPKGKDPSLEFGRLWFDGNQEQFKFSQAEQDKRDVFVKRKHAGTPNELMQGAVLNNRKNNSRKAIEAHTPIEQTAPRKTVKPPKKSRSGTLEIEDSTAILTPSVLAQQSKFRFRSATVKEDFSVEDIASRELEIADAWKELERDKQLAVTAEDSLIIQAREELLVAAERDLNKAKAIIELQEDQLSNQRWVIGLFVFLVIILLGFLFFIFRSYREKQRTNVIIAKKNKRITQSINYASRIQEAVFLREEEVAAILPESFVYYVPRDTVSGDFYWVAEMGKKVIVAAVDCTGHGVPGAFMSMIGNTLMNQIIREKGLTEPAVILQQLHEAILVALRQDQSDPMSNQDGMDMAICAIDKTNRTIDFAGAMNPMFVVQGETLEVIDGDKKGIGGGVLSRKMKKMKGYTQHSITLEKGSCFYLFSDGYMDQFGGPDGNEKFNLKRFKAMLSGIQSLNMQAQKKEVDKQLKNWQESAEQVDDILLIGVRV